MIKRFNQYITESLYKSDARSYKELKMILKALKDNFGEENVISDGVKRNEKDYWVLEGRIEKDEYPNNFLYEFEFSIMDKYGDRGHILKRWQLFTPFDESWFGDSLMFDYYNNIDKIIEDINRSLNPPVFESLSPTRLKIGLNKQKQRMESFRKRLEDELNANFEFKDWDKIEVTSNENRNMHHVDFEFKAPEKKYKLGFRNIYIRGDYVFGITSHVDPNDCYYPSENIPEEMIETCSPSKPIYLVNMEFLSDSGKINENNEVIFRDLDDVFKYIIEEVKKIFK